MKPALHSSCALNCCPTRRRWASDFSHYSITRCPISSAAHSRDTLSDTLYWAPCQFLASFIVILFIRLLMPDSSSWSLSDPRTLRSRWHETPSMLSDGKIPSAPPPFESLPSTRARRDACASKHLRTRPSVHTAVQPDVQEELCGNHWHVCAKDPDMIHIYAYVCMQPADPHTHTHMHTPLGVESTHTVPLQGKAEH